MIVFIGRRDEIAGFALCGVRVYDVEDAIGAAKVLRECVSHAKMIIISGEYADALSQDIEEIEKMKNAPIIVPIPGRYRDVGRDRIKDVIRRAIGIEIER
ncbi:MAG: hypothetical protein DRN20_00565 [Thermoplasmata archaeon]|nr:MAG: hypothetical protein DRN20_00565 [Thermoplasmata archaeon]